MDCGIEFEYLLVDAGGPTPGRVRDFSNLDFAALRALLKDKPGRDDPDLATGDLGIKSGYWYLEGDERFHPDGRFNTLAVKGVEIRTPPRAGVDAAVDCLLGLEARLAPILAHHGLGLAVAGFNPVHPGYSFDPPLNPWEETLRRRHRAYDGSLVSTMSYGPDINLSWPGWSPQRCLEAARKLNHYAPWLVPFSFSSPFAAGGRWHGLSKRTYERAGRRPAVKLFLDPAGLAQLAPQTTLVHPARLAREAGRIEFKAFDPPPDKALLAACCQLLAGVCLADDLDGRNEDDDLDLYRRAALNGFADTAIQRGAARVLECAAAALDKAGADAAALAPLHALLSARRTPAHALAEGWRAGGPMYVPGALFQHPRPATTESLCHA